jgi:transposase InsO family protein
VFPDKCPQPFPFEVPADSQCWDNAPTESFFGTMKQETGIAKFILDDCGAVEIAMLDWIDGWYNQTRRHTSLDGCSPIEFELNQAA